MQHEAQTLVGSEGYRLWLTGADDETDETGSWRRKSVCVTVAAPRALGHK